MVQKSITPKELWEKQRIAGRDVDYATWEKKREDIIEFSRMSKSCLFTVDVFMQRYDFASENFSVMFGYDACKIKRIREHGDFLEERIHPEDRRQLVKFQIEHGLFLYSMPQEQRNDYRQIFRFRILNAEQRYVNVESRHQVIETDRNGKAWIIMGIMELSPDQSMLGKVKRTVVNIKTGKIANSQPNAETKRLTNRELEILLLIGQGYLSKEIAHKLGISINTVNNHRKNILAKLGADNIIEAINTARLFGVVF